MADMTETGFYPLAIIARLMNVTPRHVQRLAIQGVIPAAQRGRYDPPASMVM